MITFDGFRRLDDTPDPEAHALATRLAVLLMGDPRPTPPSFVDVPANSDDPNSFYCCHGTRPYRVIVQPLEPEHPRYTELQREYETMLGFFAEME